MSMSQDPTLPDGVSDSDISHEEPTMETKEVFFHAHVEFINQTLQQRLSTSRFCMTEMGWEARAGKDGWVDKPFGGFTDECDVKHYVEVSLPECADDQEIQDAILDKLSEKAQRYGFEITEVEVVL